MSLELVFKMLESFGLSLVESRLYIYLAKTGPSTSEDLSNGLKMTKMQLYSVINSLKRKGIVTSKSEHVEVFSTLSFEELLNSYIKINTEKARALRENRKELVNSWQNITRQDS